MKIMPIEAELLDGFNMKPTIIPQITPKKALI
jgi:hypothetical protein